MTARSVNFEMVALFASDVHLCASRPAAADRFVAFLQGPARRCTALFLLGDIFDAWLGDDDDRAPHLQIEQALADLCASGVRVAIQHGNHDFLLGEAFQARTGTEALPEQQVEMLGGRRVLLMHGDTLCTDDVAYQAFRAQVRQPQAQAEFLGAPLDERLRRAAAMRAQSAAETELKSSDIMDVNDRAVVDAMLEHDATILVHGHTHRPAVHRHRLQTGPESAPGTRYVLGDWYRAEPIVLRADGDRFDLVELGKL